MFVHIAYGGVGLGHLRDVAEILSGVPLDYLAHFAGRMLAAGTVIKLAIERMAVGGVCLSTEPSAVAFLPAMRLVHANASTGNRAAIARNSDFIFIFLYKVIGLFVYMRCPLY